MADKKKTAKKTKLEVKGPDAPSLWPDSCEFGDKYKKAILDALQVLAKDIHAVKKQQQDISESVVKHRVRGAVVLSSSDMLTAYEDFHTGKHFLCKMGWYTCNDAQQDLEEELCRDIASTDLAKQTLVMILFDDLVTTRIDNVPFGTAIIR